MTPKVLYEKRGPVAVVTLNRPEAMNAIDLEMWQELVRIWTDFRDDPELRAAVLTGAGEKAFCAGADAKTRGDYYASMTPFQRRDKAEQEPGLGGLTRNFPLWKPVIAAVNGHCLAGGLELALACDIRVASESATFGLPEVKFGIIPGAGGTQRLPRLVPLSKALEMVLTGELITAEEAFRAGLVSRIVPRKDLLPAATALAEKICANGPLAVRAAKEAVYRGLDLPLEEGLRLEQFLAEPLRTSEDAKEGLKAFAERRRPAFRGR